MASSKISIPVVNADGNRPLVGKSRKIESDEIKADISKVIEGLGTGELGDHEHAMLRSYLYAHFHPELKIGHRISIYQSVKDALEDENLDRLRDIAGIRSKSAYINTISNVGKRSSYFGGLIGISVAGYFFLPPIVKFGVVPMARRAVKRLAPRRSYLIPIDSSLKLSSLVGKNPDAIYAGIKKALGSGIYRSGKAAQGSINTTAMDDMVGNLFFRSMIEESSFSADAKEDLRKRAQIAFLLDMARVSRQLESLTRNPQMTWDRISHYTNFAMFIKSMDSREVPIRQMLQQGVETISRAKMGSKKIDRRFYIEFERGLRHLNYAMQVVKPLDTLNAKDEFDDFESEEAKLAFLDQNCAVMERLYLSHNYEVGQTLKMFTDIKKAAVEVREKRRKSDDEYYKAFQSRVKRVIGSYRKPLLALGKSELAAYEQELKCLEP